MKRVTTLLIMAFAMVLPMVAVAAQPHIIPEPAYMDFGDEGTFHIDSKTKIVVYDEAWNPAERFAEDMMSFFKTNKPMRTAKRGNGIKVRIDSFVPAEGYEMTINANEVVITGGDEAGIYYGLQTLRQIIVTNGGSVP